MEHMHSTAPTFSLTVALLIFTALIYLRGWLRIRSLWCGDDCRLERHKFSHRFVFALVSAVASPLATLDHELLTAHMVQHLLLMTLAPAFLLLGAPLFTLSHALTRTPVKYVCDCCLSMGASWDDSGNY